MTLVRDVPAPVSSPTGNDLIDRVAGGDVAVEPGILQRAGLYDELHDGVLDRIGRRHGAHRRAMVARDGLDRLHDHLGMTEIVGLFLDIHTWLARDWRRYTPRICDALFGARPVHVVANFGLRLLVPESLSEGHGELTKPFGGLLTPAPPHRDTWGGTPPSAINIWLALTPKGAACGLYIHPDRWRHPVRRRRPYVLDPVDPLGRQIVPEAAPGDAILFGSHHIHASHPNRSNRTQLLVAFNVTPAPPRYGPEGRHWRPYIRADHAGGPWESVDRLRCAMSLAYLRHLGLLPARWWRDPARRRRKKRNR